MVRTFIRLAVCGAVAVGAMMATPADTEAGWRRRCCGNWRGQCGQQHNGCHVGGGNWGGGCQQVGYYGEGNQWQQCDNSQTYSHSAGYGPQVPPAPAPMAVDRTRPSEDQDVQRDVAPSPQN